MEVQKICQHCGQQFTAQKIATRYCSHRCNNSALKAEKRQERIAEAEKETEPPNTKQLNEIRAKEFLTVPDLAALLSCSVEAIYYQIRKGNIKAVNLGQRLTRIRRSDIDRIFEKPENNQQSEVQKETEPFIESECWSMNEIVERYGMARSTLRNIIKQHGIPTYPRYKFVFVPVKEIIKLFGEPKTQEP